MTQKSDIDKSITNNNSLNFTKNMDISEYKNCIKLDTISIPNHYEMMEYIKEKKNAIESDGVSTFLGVEHNKQNLKFELEIFPLWLRANNYKLSASINFLERIKTIFNIDLTKDNERIVKFSDYFIYIRNEDDMVDLTEDYLIFSTKYRFLYKIDMDRIFAEYSLSEKAYYFCISDNNFYYNNFLYNDSNSSLTWLINNDMEFLEMLVKEFGYDKNGRINNSVLNKACKEYYSTEPYNKDVLDNLFFKVDDINKDLQIREGLMKYILEEMRHDSESRLAMLLFDSGYYLEHFNIKEEDKLKYFSFLGYYMQLIYSKVKIDPYNPKGWNDGSFLRNELVRNKKLLKHVRDNNYYNLPDFDNMITNILEQIKVESEEYLRTHNFDNKTMQELLS